MFLHSSLSGLFLVLLVALAWLEVASGCTASRHHQHAAARARLRQAEATAATENSVSKYPTLFKFGTSAKSRTLSEVACSSFSDAPAAVVSCDVVEVDIGALKKNTIKLPFGKDNSKFLLLKKVSEEGMEFLDDESKSSGPATVSFKNGKDVDSFVVKQGGVFGSFSVPAEENEGEGPYKAHLTTCPGKLRCQVLVVVRSGKKRASSGKS